MERAIAKKLRQNVKARIEQDEEGILRLTLVLSKRMAQNLILEKGSIRSTVLGRNIFVEVNWKWL